MICLELNWFFSDPSWILQISEFVWALRSSVWIVFNNFLLIEATDRSDRSSDQKRLFFIVSHLSFLATTPFNTPKLLQLISFNIIHFLQSVNLECINIIILVYSVYITRLQKMCMNFNYWYTDVSIKIRFLDS